MPDQTNPLFKMHLLNDEGIALAKAQVAAFDAFLTALSTDLGCKTDSREFSIVKTKLEEAAFFAKKSMAIRAELQKEA